MRALDAHIRRRLRAILLHHWRRRPTIVRNLIALGVKRKAAWQGVYQGRRSLWALSHIPQVDRALRPRRRGLMSGSSDAVVAVSLLGLLLHARAVVSRDAPGAIPLGASSRSTRGSWVVRGVGGTLIVVERGVDPMRLRGRRPPAAAGAVAAVLLVAVCTVLVYPLKQVTTVSSLGVVYLLGVVIVSAYWGLWFGVAMSVLSAAAFNFFHLPPVGRFTVADSRNWVALGAFLVVAVATSSVSELARTRASEAERRRAEADLTADMAQLLLARTGVEDALVPIGRRLAAAFELSWASISLREQHGDARREAIALSVDERRMGTLLVPAALRPSVAARLRERVVPALAAVLEVAIERERLVAEVVETEALRRSDAVKTAVLRTVSHDLRSPVTAMVTAGAAVRAPDLTLAERDELGGMVVEEGARLSRLIENLLDLSRLEAQAAAPRPAECSVEELIDAALVAQPSEASFDVRIDPGLRAVRADFVQVERALSNLLENASRYANGGSVSVRARPAGGRAVIRVTDRGPGISAAEQERIFEPFYRAPARAGEAHTGSGLGLAIAKGFIEANGGRIAVESTPGQGTSFVVELPLVGEVSA